MTLAGDRAGTAFTGLSALAGCGGCAAKAPPEVVAMLAGLAAAAGAARVADPAAVGGSALVGLDPADDAVVYPLEEGRALVATVDFFPPLVDDPADYGTIAAANAVSDVYAMGGEVAFALAISGFPAVVPSSVVAEVNRAAAMLVARCGGAVLGGHSIRCAEPVFGLCVLGFVHPQRIWRKAGAQVGDVLMLSKPLGTGLLLSAKREEWLPQAIRTMRETNQAAAHMLKTLAVPPKAVTDITGYGLLGHASEMAERSGVTLRLNAQGLPLLPGVLEVVAAGVRTSAHRTAKIPAPAVDPVTLAILQDPQTSGGLLVAVSPEAVAPLLAAGWANVGEVVAGPAGVVVDGLLPSSRRDTAAVDGT
jgi:selenide,water dikinase